MTLAAPNLDLDEVNEATRQRWVEGHVDHVRLTTCDAKRLQRMQLDIVRSLHTSMSPFLRCAYVVLVLCTHC